jgi:hypothetical protein
MSWWKLYIWYYDYYSSRPRDGYLSHTQHTCQQGRTSDRIIMWCRSGPSITPLQQVVSKVKSPFAQANRGSLCRPTHTVRRRCFPSKHMTSHQTDREWRRHQLWCSVGILATELERQERILGQQQIWMSHFPQNTASPPATPLLLYLELDTTCKLVNVYYLTLSANQIVLHGKHIICSYLWALHCNLISSHMDCKVFPPCIYSCKRIGKPACVMVQAALTEV